MNRHDTLLWGLNYVRALPGRAVAVVVMTRALSQMMGCHQGHSHGPGGRGAEMPEAMATVSLNLRPHLTDTLRQPPAVTAREWDGSRRMWHDSHCPFLCLRTVLL